MLVFERRMLQLLDEYIDQCIRNNDESFVASYERLFRREYDVHKLIFLVRDLLGAGSETTKTTLRWAIVYLANHQDWLTRLQAQVSDTVSL